MAKGRFDLMRFYCPLGSSTTSMIGLDSITNRRTLSNGAKSRLYLAENIVGVLCSELRLGVYTNSIHLTGLSLSRQQDALVRCLYWGDTVSEQAHKLRIIDWAHIVAFARPCGRWWLDILIARRSFQRGILVNITAWLQHK